MSKRLLATVLVATLGILVGSIAQQALAVEAGLGQYFSKAGRNTYYGGESGQQFGNQVSTYAQPGSQLLWMELFSLARTIQSFQSRFFFRLA